jgi:hypothetical protein
MIKRNAFVLLGLVLLMLPAARASETDQATKVTFSQTVQIPGRLLPAGTYWFVVDPAFDSKIVRIFSQDRLTLCATLETIPSEHPRPSEETEITFANLQSMQPEAIVTWFYPGRTIGHEFVYSKHERKEIAKNQEHTVVSSD